MTEVEGIKSINWNQILHFFIFYFPNGRDVDNHYISFLSAHKESIAEKNNNYINFSSLEIHKSAWINEDHVYPMYNSSKYIF